jgi:DNA-directed RNA polymerase specialized sigma24 family protein
MAASRKQTKPVRHSGLNEILAACSTPPTTAIDARLAQLAAGDTADREELVALACERMFEMAHRMLGRCPKVRRYEDTDDVVQNALVRLHRALASMSLESIGQFIGLAALQIRRRQRCRRRPANRRLRPRPAPA